MITRHSCESFPAHNNGKVTGLLQTQMKGSPLGRQQSALVSTRLRKMALPVLFHPLGGPYRSVAMPGIYGIETH